MSETSSANSFRQRLSLRRPRSASSTRLTERQPWGMDGNHQSHRTGNFMIYRTLISLKYVSNYVMADIHNIYHVFIIFVGSSSCLSPFGSPASSASSWLKKTMSSGKAPSLPNQLYHNDTTGNHSTKKKYSFFKVCLLASIKPSGFENKHTVNKSSA